jgi:hypothetical protein
MMHVLTEQHAVGAFWSGQVQAQLAAGQQGGADIGFPQFLEMFRADLLDLGEILAYLQLGSAAPDGLATLPQALSPPDSAGDWMWRLASVCMLEQCGGVEAKVHIDPFGASNS